MEWKNHYAVDTVFQFVASFTDRSIGLQASCNLARVRVQYTNIVNSVSVDHRGVRWVERELSELWSEIEELKLVV